MKTINKIGLIGLATIGIYLAACIPNSIKMSQALKETEYADMFQAAASRASFVQDPNSDRGELDCGGNLDDILNHVDHFLRLNDSFRIARWTASGYYAKDSFVIETSTPSTVFCYNPFKRIN